MISIGRRKLASEAFVVVMVVVETSMDEVSRSQGCCNGLQSANPSCWMKQGIQSVLLMWTYLLLTKAAVSSSNPLNGRMSMKKCSVDRRLKERGPCGPQSLEEGSEGHISCQI